MKRTNLGTKAITAILVLSCSVMWAQNPAPQPLPQGNGQILPPEQLDNLVAPVALYPDPLLAQVLAASTYPLEVVEAQQWLQQNRNLRGMQLVDAARQQNWDPSVQALVAFPDVLELLNRDIRWTTDLGNANLAQPSDVIAAVQRMRQRAEQNGTLRGTPQQTVTTQTQNGQSAIAIEPANPQVIYVPVYNPQYIWGPPVWGYYPPLWYPAVGFGFGFGPGIYLAGFFPGWGGWGWGGWPVGWGWGLGWFGGGIYVNHVFFNHYGFHGYSSGFYGRQFAGGREAWQHDPYHRAGVGYSNPSVTARYNNARFTAGRSYARAFAGAPAARGFGGAPSARGFAPSSQARVGGADRSFAGSNFSNQGFRGYSGSRFGGAARSYSAPRASGGFGGGGSASGGGRSFGGGHSFGGSHSGGGHSGGRR